MFGQIKSHKGQASPIMLVQMVVAVVIGFVVLSLGMTLVNNFQGNLLATPQNAVPFNSMWPLAVAAVLIIGVILGLLKLVH